MLSSSCDLKTIAFRKLEHDILSNYPKAIHKLQRNQLDYEIIRDAGHAINHEQAYLVNQKIIEFWNE
ncbi:hypothetical protein D3C74_00230 [compost metagenome]